MVLKSRTVYNKFLFSVARDSLYRKCEKYYRILII